MLLLPVTIYVVLPKRKLIDLKLKNTFNNINKTKMRKPRFLLLIAILCIAGRAGAQLVSPCMSDEMTKRLHEMDPQVVQGLKNNYKQQIAAAMKNIDLSKVTRTTQVDQSGNPSFWYDIPVVVHIVHDYNESANGEWLTDNFIFNALKDWNTVYAKLNGDTSDVIAPFKKWIGNPHIRLHLATIDPNGNPTHGITRHRSYLTYIGGDQSKVDDWSPTSYVNIWSVNQMNATNGFAAAYAYWPSEAAGIPFWDGIICLSSYVDQGGASSIGNGASYKTINHEMGHVFNLLHPWGATNNPQVACGDDNVDDTPPTMGHYVANCNSMISSGTQNGVNDTLCATNYYKMYTNISGHDSLVNYPDTTNVQNIMDYSYCAKMFTIGQVARMHDALNSNVAGRNNLFDTANLINTGVLDPTGTFFIPRLDLKPILEFSATRTSNGGYPLPTTYMNVVQYFTFPNSAIEFHNESWNDTLTNLRWIFSNGATIADTTTTSVLTNNIFTFHNSFTQPGWVDLKMIGTGNNSGVDTAEWQNAVFVADAAGTPATGYVQEWNPSGDRAKWPFFNYYNNEFQWTLDSTVGFDDHYCMKYTGFDSRLNTDPFNPSYPLTGTPAGDFDDLFTVPMDLSAYSDSCNLNFWYASASRSSSSVDINDTLEIDYTTTSNITANGVTWQKLVILSKATLINNGPLATPFTPSSMLNWSPQTIPLPAAARTSYTTFRFRYWPHAGSDGIYSSGNNFYMDNLSFGRLPASVSTVKLTSTDVAVVPNPTNGDAYVVIKDANNAAAKIVVTDVTGKVVYTTSQQINGNEAHIIIPHNVISVSGIYMVQTITGNQSNTKKLVVY